MPPPLDGSSMSPLKFGILGCGRIVQRGLIPGLKGSQLAVLHALASERPGVAQEWATTHGVPHAYDSYQAVLDNPEVDAVYIPCTGEEHIRWTLAAAKAGKHVLCEKPLALNMEEAHEMVEACRSAGVILQEAFMWRHHPRSKMARALVRQGAIGPLRQIVASFSFDIDRNDWRLLPERGGGAMWDVGCYGVNCSRYFTETEPTQIDSSAHWWPTGVDMTMRIGLTFPGDILANVDCSFELPYRCQAEIVGEKGTILIEDAFVPPDVSVLKIKRGVDKDTPWEEIQIPAANQYAEQVNDFCRSISAGHLVDPGEDGLANMKVLELAHQLAAGRS